MMKPTLCIVGGCNGAGKTTLARELLPRLGIRRFLNADMIAYGLSPLDPTLRAFQAGRLLIAEAQELVKSRVSFGLESTVSGKSHLNLIRLAKQSGYRLCLHYVMLASAAQAVERVAFRVRQGGHDVPEADIRRRFERSKVHFVEYYAPLAEEWVLWDNTEPPIRHIADHKTHRPIDLMLTLSKLQELPELEMCEAARIGLEAGRAATAKMLDYYRRMGIAFTPQITLPQPTDTSS